MFINPGSATIIYTSNFFQPDNSEFDDDYFFIGPQLLQQKASKDRYQGIKAPVVYVCFGTVSNPEFRSIFQSIILQFNSFKGSVIISTGGHLDAGEFNEVPDHIRIEKWVPQLEVLSLADVFVTHGGLNSVQEGIWSVVRLLVYPQTGEQRETAEQVQYLNAGIVLEKQDIEDAKLAAIVEDLLKDKESVSNSLKKIRSSFIEAKKNSDVRKIIEDLIEKS